MIILEMNCCGESVRLDILEKALPKTFGEIKKEQRIERSPFILYFFYKLFPGKD